MTKKKTATETPVISNDKYESIGETKIWFGVTLHRIRAKRSFGLVVAGALGGFVASEANLQVSGNAWVSGDAWVYGDARVYGNAQVSGNAQVYGDAWVYGVIQMATRSDGYTFVVAPTAEGARIIAGCRYFTIAEARAHWTNTRGGTPLGEESLALVDFLERMAIIRGFIDPTTETSSERPSNHDWEPDMQEREYQFEAWGVEICGVEVGEFTGTAFISIDNGWTMVDSIDLDGVKRVRKHPGGTRWTEDATLSIHRDQGGPLERAIFQSIADRLEMLDFTGDTPSLYIPAAQRLGVPGDVIPF